MMKPISELLVLDFSRYLPGGYATQVLADMGARVIKIEDTDKGDLCRHDYPIRNNVSFYISALGRNKESASLNLKNTEVQSYLHEIAKKADVIVESFRPGVTKKLGVDYETIRAINPSVVYCSITGYGEFDPRSLKVSHDVCVQATTGYLDINGGVITPLPLVDVAAHSVATQAIFAALYQRGATGEGAYVDISMFDTFVWWNSLIDSRWSFNGGQCTADDLDSPSGANNLYQTKDGRYLAFSMIEKKFWDGFCDAVEAPELKVVHLHRRWEYPEEFEKIEAIVKSRTLAEWEEFFADKDFGVEPVLSKDEGIARILEQEPNMLRYVDFPRAGRVLQTGIPHKVSSIPFDLASVRECPALGEQTEQFLSEAGASPETIARLAEEGVVGLNNAPIEPDRIPLAPRK